MIRIATLTFIGALLGSAALNAQNPFSNDAKTQYNMVKNSITRAADEMPEADYSFKASPMERTFGEIVAHIADVQMGLCGTAKGEQKKADTAGKTSKADLVSVLKESFDYCDSVYNSMTDAQGGQMIKMFGRLESTRLGALNFNNNHDNEMYGQMVVYLRIKGMVPPSSQRRQR